MLIHSTTRLLSWGCVFTALLCGGTSAGRLCAETVVIRAAAVHTGEGAVHRPGVVVVQDGKIQYVGPADGAPDTEDPQQVDLGSGSLMPGLIDVYTQTGVAGSSEPTNEVTALYSPLMAVDWHARGWREQQNDGVTSVGLFPDTNNVVGGRVAVVKTAGAARPRTMQRNAGLLFNVCSDPARGNSARRRPDSIFVRQPTNRMGVVWVLRSTLDQVRKGADAPGMQGVLQGDRKIFGYSRTEFDIRALLDIGDEFGFAPIVVGGLEAYRMTDELARRQTPVVLGRISTGGNLGPEGSELAWNQAGQMAAKGVTIAIAGGDVLEQARFAHRFGLDAETAIQSVTRVPARLLGVDQRVGTLKTGMDADLVAFSGAPLEFTSSIRWVMIDGKLVCGEF